MKNISAITTPEHVEKKLNTIALHDHLCLLYNNTEEQLASAIPFIRIGLERHEKCVYIVDENTTETVLDAMRAQGIDIGMVLQDGSLTITSKHDTYLRNGYFDPDEMIQFLANATMQAEREGYSGLRVTGEMSWMFGGEPGTDRLMEYEAKLNDFFQTHNALALCQYNRHRFSPELLIAAVHTHPIVVVDNEICRNFYYIPTKELRGTNIKTAQKIDDLINNLINQTRAVAELTTPAIKHLS